MTSVSIFAGALCLNFSTRAICPGVSTGSDDVIRLQAIRAMQLGIKFRPCIESL